MTFFSGKKLFDMLNIKNANTLYKLFTYFKCDTNNVVQVFVISKTLIS